MVENKKYFFQRQLLMVEIINKNVSKLEISIVFVQPTSRLFNEAAVTFGPTGMPGTLPADFFGVIGHFT